MKVKLKNVMPNPFRDMESYPIHPQKIELLKKSIESTEFWENVVARDAGNGKIELAYGHHRLTALREIYGPNTEFNWIVRDLDDEEMLKIMADENAQEWGHVSDVERETVRAVVKAYSEDKIGLHKPEGRIDQHRRAPSFCFPKESKLAGKLLASHPYTADTIVSFLHGTMSIDTVKYTLRALCLIEQGYLKESQLKGLSSSQARTVVNETARTIKQAEAVKKEAEKQAKKETAPAKQKHITQQAEETAKALVSQTASAVSKSLQKGGGAAEAKSAGLGARVKVMPKQKEMPEINKAASSLAAKLERLLDPDYKPGSELEELIKYKKYLEPSAKNDLNAALTTVVDWAEGYITRLK